MKVLVVGSGGREHALVWKLAQSPRVKKVFAAPGNAGTAELAENVSVAATDSLGLLQFAQMKRIDLTVVGPEAPLTAGLVDLFVGHGLAVYGPTRAAAAIEGSKVFSKGLMQKYNIPTAEHQVFSQFEEARSYIEAKGAPLVLKADGLAAGKGVIVAFTKEEALIAAHEILTERCFGAAGDRLIIEEYLEGEEVTVLAFSDGEHVLTLEASQDHKRAFDGDRGPNTGGMGAYSPVPALTREIREQVENTILKPTVAAMVAEGCPYHGVLYAGIMLTSAGPKVLEFNARFGDPEAQVVLPRLETDLVEVAEATLAGRLDSLHLAWRPEAALTVVLASGGNPGRYETGLPIQGLAQAAAQPDALVFHAGTRREGEQVVTAGGRVLAITGMGPDLAAARERAYEAAGMIDFPGLHLRRDIGWRALGSFSTGNEGK
ncbi:MAG: phosphoribosylamine--glycine ligase [Firmicutes bacterium]|nr:phosphoribosylamine--glycine ligase [Bacillota bacterium]